MRLRQLLAGGNRHAAGSIQLVGLNALRTELGDRWNSVKARVHDQTERLLDRHLAPTDVWLRADEANYLVVFATLDRQAGELISGRIVAELHRIMLGSADTSRIAVRSIVTEIDGHLAVEMTTLDQLMANLLVQSAASPKSVTEADEGRPAAPTVASELVAFLPGICFRPVFDVSHKVLSTYVCHPDGATKRQLSALSNDEMRLEEHIFESDVEVLRRSIEIYGELYQNSFRYMQNVTVGFSTLSIGRYRRDYLAICHEIPVHLLPFMVFVLRGVPPGVPYGRVAEITTILKPYCRAILVLIDDGVPNLAAFAQAGVRGLGVTIQPGEPEIRAANRINTLGAHVRRHGMLFFVDGIRTATMLRVAEEAGASYVAGPLIGGETDVPEHMKHVTERELIQRSAKLTRRH
ncbi:hypothetical protein A6A40_29045 (plasmid) [Azospirillum humicireducens]|uniref:Uncharacterized protein n=1 Tax=Azospirillum humicireducens TaxID=1226968 RepID=A0A2R4VXW1_9PROT|nr:hypothetical protein A6A40_29045 [Azospirillum humicireducens]